jgi:hypothetical protein
MIRSTFLLLGISTAAALDDAEHAKNSKPLLRQLKSTREWGQKNILNLILLSKIRLMKYRL